MSDGTFHTLEEMKEKPKERFILFRPGRRVDVGGTPMIICRTKGDRLILRGENASETLREKRIREEFDKECADTVNS